MELLQGACVLRLQKKSTTLTDLPLPWRAVNAPSEFQMNQGFANQLHWTHILFLIWSFQRKCYLRLENSCHSPPPHSSTLTLLLWRFTEESMVKFTCQARVMTPLPCWHLESFQTHSWGKQNLEAKEKQSCPVMLLHNVRLCFVKTVWDSWVGFEKGFVNNFIWNETKP